MQEDFDFINQNYLKLGTVGTDTDNPQVYEIWGAHILIKHAATDITVHGPGDLWAKGPRLVDLHKMLVG